MQRTWWILAAALVAVGAPGTVQGQEEEETPPVVRISFFMCDLSDGAGEAIAQEFETRDIPIWNELVAEGRVQEWGTFFHSWADEWNVGIYTIAESIQAIVDASDEAGNRLEQRFGDATTRIEQACPHHRDGFYTAGPSTGMGVEAGS